MRALLLALPLVLGACAYKVEVDSEPPGATMTLPPKVRITQPKRIPVDRVVRLPVTVRLQWFPFQRHLAVVTLPGYRPAEVDLARQWARGVDWSDPLLWARRAQRIPADVGVVVRLVPDHGLVGSWSADAVP